jgi:hypothetical protein
MSFFNNNGSIQFLNTKSNLKKETSRPTKVYTEIPKPFEGVDGEQRLIDTGKTKYLYSKINSMWLKTKLSKPSESDVETTTTESTSGTDSSGGGGTTSNAITVSFNYTYDTGDGSQYLQGWNSYLAACKETEASGFTVTTKLDAAHNGLSNGSFLRESTTVNSGLIIPEGLSNAGHGYHYFSTEQIGGSNSYYLFKLDYTGEITGVRGRLPSGVSITESGTTSSDEITVAVAGNAEITESVRIYWKLNSAGSYGANDYVSIDTSGTTSTSWSDTYTFNASNAGLSPSASTAYKFKTEPRNTASQQNVGNITESEVITTPSAAGSWTVPSDFTLAAYGSGNVGNFFYGSKQVTLTNGNTGTNSTTVSWVKDSGSVLTPGFAISASGNPGTTGTANGGTGWNEGNNASKTIDLGSSSATLYIIFRHRFKGSYVGSDANISVTFSNTSGNVADNTDLDITMTNAEGIQP